MLSELVVAPRLPPREPTTSEMRAWALAQGIDVSDRGRLSVEVVDPYHDAHGQ